MRATLMLAVIAAGLASACASTATNYQPATAQNPHGYAESMLEENKARITFSGNSSTELATVKKYVLFRAAELTLNSGYDYFVMIDRGVESSAEYRTKGPVRPRFGGGELEQSGASYEAMADITMFRGMKPDILPNAYDAHQVQRNLDAGIVRPTKNQT
ncbi:MAG TPA: hypothetical protein VG942_08090 [Hyphomonadaceae bacterium]|nr:hypothetical protein [Hyphomonadaceae bacterium]